MGVASKIGEIAKSKGIALKELSRQTDIPYTTLYNAVKRDSKMEFETVKKLLTYSVYRGMSFTPVMKQTVGLKGGRHKNRQL